MIGTEALREDTGTDHLAKTAQTGYNWKLPGFEAVMKTCPHCLSLLAATESLCRQCGRSSESAESIEVVTRQLTTDMLRARAKELRRRFPLNELFGSRALVVIGRTADCDLSLSHPTVSRRHALIEKRDGTLQVTDLGSSNGTTLGGQRLLKTSHPFRAGVPIGIGPFQVMLDGADLLVTDHSRQIRLEARRLEKVVATAEGKPRKLLDDVTVVVEPGEFVGLLGPSGSGKSTLMDCLNGRRRATGGQMLANGEDFYQHFDNFRQSIGYVPQRDIVHSQLTVERALQYTARLRLPPDTTGIELQTRVEEVLHEMELASHRSSLICHLSGGQVKRVSLGAELLARPSLLFIDEATSGLDAGTEARMMKLFRQLADEGKSLLCITHHLESVELCHLIVVLANGRLVYYGPPAEARGYFNVERLPDIYNRLPERSAVEWAEKFADSDVYEEFVNQRQHATPQDPPSLHGEGGPDRVMLKPNSRPAVLQWRVLTARYTELLWNDRRSLRLLLLQAPVVALLLLLGFVRAPYEEKILSPRQMTDDERKALVEMKSLLAETQGTPNPFTAQGQAILKLRRESPHAAAVLEQMRTAGLLDKLHDATQPVVPEAEIINPRYSYLVLFILGVTVLWLGCNNASKEIVKEAAIYGRERAVNLGIGPYLGSKFIVLSLLSAVQVALLLLTVFGTLEALHAILGHQVPPLLYRLDYLSLYGVFVLLAVVGVALGLLLSAAVSTPDRANALLPYVLIPQIILGGGIVSVESGLLHLAAITASPVYWAFRAARRGETTLPPEFPFHTSYNDALWIPILALSLQAVVLLSLTAWLLRRKDTQ